MTPTGLTSTSVVVAVRGRSSDGSQIYFTSSSGGPYTADSDVAGKLQKLAATWLFTTPDDEERWTKNYRIPDLVLLTPDRFHIDKCDYMAGAPLVCVEIFSPDDESYEKLPFYASLGVPDGGGDDPAH